MKEQEIRPQNIFDEYLKLAAIDVETFFSRASKKQVNCPSCGAKGKLAFTKLGFSYEECPQCLTLFVSPRPVKEAFDNYYTDSPSTKFWATTFYKETEAARREKLWKPKAALIKEKIEKYSKAKTVVDIAGGYGTFAQEIQKLVSSQIVIIEPSVYLAQVCRDKRFSVIEKFLEDTTVSDLPAGEKFFVSFELFEHLHDPSVFFESLRGLMKSGDVFVFTTLSGTGVDIQVLWENSKSVSPPHHLNFINPRSIVPFLDRHGFSSLEITTPGKLDIDIMWNNRDKIKDRFWLNLLNHSTEKERATLQDFVTANLLSSHMMVVCQKK